VPPATEAGLRPRAGSEPPPTAQAELPLVAVAVDAPGAGRRTYTYHLPAQLIGVAPGEAVLVEFGRRQALGVVLGPTLETPTHATKPVLDRVRTDGPLLPPLGLAMAAWISEHYLVPPAMTVRAMLPPGLLERLELVAELRPGTSSRGGADEGPVADSRDAALLDVLAAGPRPVRDLSASEGRATLLRRLRALRDRGLIDLEWTLSTAAAGPRYVRWVRLTGGGAEASVRLERGERPAGRPLGPRQVAALAELAAGPPDGMPAPELAGRHGAAALASLVRRDLLATEVRERPRRPLERRAAGRRGGRPGGADLTEPQGRAVDTICAALASRDATPLLLDGVTGGGKTAIYSEAIAACLGAGRPALVLVPEIALAIPLVDRLRADLVAEIAILHSGLGDGERADEWRRIRAGSVDVVVGTRMAVLAPLSDVGLVIVDEEHDAAYKSDRSPRYQARDAAITLGALAGSAVVLGSATPAVDTVGRARTGQYRREVLPARPTGRPPRIDLVDLRAELAEGNRGLLSRDLVRAIDELDTAAGERAILAINRRGSASVVMCRDCGAIQSCPDCERPLVYHVTGGTLRCHHCGRAFPPAGRCPACASPRIRFLGGGTQRVERELVERFPGLRIGRLDRDVAERRGAAVRVIDDFTGGRLDVLVGTSLVTKGLDVPEVVLVGIVSADVALSLPDERASERTYQFLAQAVGRAGRGDRPGRAIVQTYQPDHPAVQAVVRGEPSAFYDAELALRERFRSPPFGQLVKLAVGLPDREQAAAAARQMATSLRDRVRASGAAVSIIGPAPAFVPRRAGRWRYHVVLRGERPVELLGDGPDPPWSVDVDPESLL